MTASPRREPCRESGRRSAGTLRGSPNLDWSCLHLLDRAAGEALAGGEASAADQCGGFLAGQRRVVSVGAEAQRSLGDDRREELVGTEAERHLREARPQRADVG